MNTIEDWTGHPGLLAGFSLSSNIRKNLIFSSQLSNTQFDFTLLVFFSFYLFHAYFVHTTLYLKPYTYHIGEPIILKTASNTKYGKHPYVGLYRVAQVNNNGTVRYADGTITDTGNIRNIHLYHVQETIH